MALENSISILQSHGQKITKTRRWLLEKLESLSSPLNPYELIEQEPQAKIDITTIYRNLNLFEELWIAHKIASLGWYMPCTHHHNNCSKIHDIVICNSCHSIEETHIDSTTKKSFWLSDGPVELSGECYSCKYKKVA